jgi:hypothetical protein
MNYTQPIIDLLKKWEQKYKALCELDVEYLAKGDVQGVSYCTAQKLTVNEFISELSAALSNMPTCEKCTSFKTYNACNECYFGSNFEKIE